MSHFRKIVMYGGLACVGLMLSGCVVAPRPYRPYPAHSTAVQPPVAIESEYVQTAPPSPYTEVVPSSPGVGYVWVPGLWLWSGGRYHWRAGAWSLPPAGFSHWTPGGWSHQPGRGWYFFGGRWR